MLLKQSALNFKKYKYLLTRRPLLSPFASGGGERLRGDGDLLRGGGERDLLLGEFGDLLRGAGGERDLLLGESGDLLRGGGDRDLLLGDSLLGEPLSLTTRSRIGLRLRRRRTPTLPLRSLQENDHH